MKLKPIDRLPEDCIHIDRSALTDGNLLDIHTHYFSLEEKLYIGLHVSRGDDCCQEYFEVIDETE